MSILDMIMVSKWLSLAPKPRHFGVDMRRASGRSASISASAEVKRTKTMLHAAEMAHKWAL